MLKIINQNKTKYIMAEAKAVNAEKLKALQLTMDRLEKSYGKGTIMKLGDAPVLDVEVIPTGSLNLDLAFLVSQS